MIGETSVRRISGARATLAIGAIVTIAITFWMRHLQMLGGVRGLTPVFYGLFAYADYTAALCMLLIFLLAAVVPQRLHVQTLLGWVGEHPLTIAAASAVALAAGSVFVYQNHPLSMDEYAAYFQSRVFAAGHLSGRFPPELLDWLVPVDFRNFFLNLSPVTGSVAESYWPGFSLLMAPFTWAGVPWLCNPVISALTLLVIHRLATEVFGSRQAAGLAVLLTVASPVFFGEGISYYSMPAHLLTNAIFALLLIRPTLRNAFVAGVVGSFALSLHNPIPHLLFALPWFVWIAKRPGGVRLLAALCAGYLPLCLLLGVGWFVFSTHLIHQGVVENAPAVDFMGRLHKALSVFSFPTAIVLLARGIGIAKIWVWAVPGMFILACSGAVRWRHNALCQLLAASALVTLLGYLFVPVDQGHGWGFRYFHSAWLALPLLAVGAVFRPAGSTKAPGIFEDQATLVYVVSCIALSLVVGVGQRAMQMQTILTVDLEHLPHYTGRESQVVLMRAASPYDRDLVQNDPWLRTSPIRLMSKDADSDLRMMSQFFPGLRCVYSDKYGQVWSDSAAQAPVCTTTGATKPP